ncbi:CaiB/BaiF CoA transferase family protein [Martelella soudanensis]|uniref:CaiB/BaiF CoA transferase family protein n=1 Tax=unclassified Martelella TaxID=2629616 RepID=UPI0015DE6440|nr:MULTISPECIES: CaiB/BaiF CoA-transferase family protein [unclassified Martelella]
MRPLEGLVVVSMEQAVAAPLCTARLADAGATVIKIERPEGDFARKYDRAALGQSSYFVWINRGKKSVVLDLNKKADQHACEALIKGADVFVQNLRPGAADKLGFPISRLRAEYPQLICCSISGYGEAEGYADRKAYDLLIQAESGLASLSGPPGMSARVGISVVDIATAVTANAAILEAIIARKSSAQGCDIRVSMFDVMAEWLTVPLLSHEAGLPTQNSGLSHPLIAPYGTFEAADGAEILLAIQSEHEWKALCGQVFGQPELVFDPRFVSNHERVKNRVETDGLVRREVLRFNRDDLTRALSEQKIAFAQVNSMDGFAAHPALRRVPVETEKGNVSLPAHPVTVDGGRRRLGRVPRLGADTNELISGLDDCVKNARSATWPHTFE